MLSPHTKHNTSEICSHNTEEKINISAASIFKSEPFTAIIIKTRWMNTIIRRKNVSFGFLGELGCTFKMYNQENIKCDQLIYTVITANRAQTSGLRKMPGMKIQTG